MQHSPNWSGSLSPVPTTLLRPLRRWKWRELVHLLQTGHREHWREFATRDQRDSRTRRAQTSGFCATSKLQLQPWHHIDRRSWKSPEDCHLCVAHQEFSQLPKYGQSGHCCGPRETISVLFKQGSSQAISPKLWYSLSFPVYLFNQIKFICHKHPLCALFGHGDGQTDGHVSS